MTNAFFVAVWVLWSTNRMDTLLTPSGDDIMRHTITSQTHVYQIPGYTPVTNVVPVLTNSVHLRMKLVEVELELPPVPTWPYSTWTNLVTTNSTYWITNSSKLSEKWTGGYEPPPFNPNLKP